MNKKGSHSTDNNSWESLAKTKEEELRKDLKELKRLIKIWRSNESQLKTDSSDVAILLQYAHFLEEANNIDYLKGPFLIETINYKQDMKNIKTQKEIFLGIPFLHHKEWRLNFTQQFIRKISSFFEPIIIDIFLKLYIYVQGFLSFTPGKFISLKAYQRVSRFSLKYFTNKMEIGHDLYFLLFSIGVHKMPHYDFKGVLESFDYVYMITCEDVIHNIVFYNEKKIKAIFDSLENRYEEDIKLCYSKEELKVNQEFLKKKIDYYHNKKKGDNQQLPVKIYPTIYKCKKIDVKNNEEFELEIEDFQFRLDQYIKYRIRSQYFQSLRESKKGVDYFRKQIDEQLDEFENSRITQRLQLQTARNEKILFKSHANIIQNLEKMPRFKFALTIQQRNVLYRSGNLIIMGRSGTGKTTCAMLRLYGIEILIKMKEYNSLKKQEKRSQPQEKCMMAHLDEIKLTKNVFLTFSSILIEEIKRQYDDMIFQIKEKHAEKCSSCANILKQNKIEDKEEDLFDRIARQQQEQQKRVIALDSIELENFPSFFIIENFIRVIDKTIHRPFFSQQPHKNEFDQGQNIKYARINRYEYNSKAIILKEVVNAAYVDYEFFLKQIWGFLPKQFTKATKEYCLITSSVVWSEIFSILKGSLNSYLYPQGYISLKMYIQHSQSIFNRQSEKMVEYKKRVYKILKSYMEWCKNKKAYDLMDVVNHNLREIEFYGYQGPKINYMFVDQVQDSTASTTLLISKMVINNIFYCGDTAQAITRGVSFRFEDLKLLFNQEHYNNALTLDPPEDIISLTVNFRSHNYILQLANSIVSSLEILFPTQINKLKKEKSDLFGPKPFLIINQDPFILFQLICGNDSQLSQKQLDEMNLRDIRNSSPDNHEKQLKKEQFYQGNSSQDQQSESQQQVEKRTFSNEQIIIVRNEQQKLKLPPSLQKKGMIFTPQKVKGLQYDEIILYNFFESCPIYDKWNSLLQHIECIQGFQDEKIFEQQLSRRNFEEKNKEEKLTMESKLLLGYIPSRKQYKTWSIKANQSINEIKISLYHEMSTQLKILYTAITRARSVFTIFDTRIPKNLLKIWQIMDLVVFVNEMNVKICHEKISKYVKIDEKHVKYENFQNQWFETGREMLQRKQYQNAKKCFKNIKRFDLVERIQAKQMEIKAQHGLYQIKTALERVQNLDRDDRKIAKARFQKQKKQSFKLYVSAAKIYERRKRPNDAGNAYFKAQCYEPALNNYHRAKNMKNEHKMAICCKKLKKYKDAIDIFKNINDIEGIIECYIDSQNWQLLLKLFITHPEYASQYKSCNIAQKCVKSVINNIIFKAADQDRKFYEQFYQFQNRMQNNEKAYNENELSYQVKSIILQFSYNSLKIMQEKLQLRAKKYQQIQKNYQLELINYQDLCQSLQDKKQGYDLTNNLKNVFNQKLQQINNQLSSYQFKPLSQKNDPKFSKLINQLQFTEEDRAQFYKKAAQLKVQLNSLQDKIINQDELLKKIKIEKQSLEKKYNYENINFDRNFISNKLKQTITSFQTEGKIIRKDDDDDICSVSDISQLTQLWSEFDNKIGGMRLSDKTKYQVIQELKQVVKISEIFMKYPIENQYPAFHHKFMEQKIFRLLPASEDISLLKKCRAIEENMACLIICDFSEDNLICFSPKYILGALLEFSNNFKQDRYFKNEMYQINLSTIQQIKSQKEEMKNENEIETI